MERVESIANWCSVDTQTGRLVVILEKNYCFDAEAYADELGLENAQDFRDDQRSKFSWAGSHCQYGVMLMWIVNLGKWVLRYLFARFVDVEIQRDVSYRGNFANDTSGSGKPYPPKTSPSTHLPVRSLNDERQDDLVTLKSTSTNPTSPGIAAGLTQTPSNGFNAAQSSSPNGTTPNASEDHSNLEKQISHNSNLRSSLDTPRDRFTSNSDARNNAETNQETNGGVASPPDVKDEKAGGTLFGKFRVNFPKKLGRSSVEVKRPVVEQKSSESSLKSDGKEDRPHEQYLCGTIEAIRGDYDAQLRASPSHIIVPAINPSLPNDTPPLVHPSYTTIIIQEEQPDAGGVADLYRGTVSSVGHDADMIEKCAPRWLGELLLRVRVCHV